jgi:tetratricopeptide (TPR) repeat protein
LKRRSQPFAAQLALAKLWIAAGSPEKAMTYVQQALAVQPRSPEARAVRIEILLAQNDRSQAKKELASLQKEFPNSVLTVFMEGTLQMAEGQLDAARASFNRVAASRPYDNQTIASLVKIDLLSGRKKEAVDRIETALKGQQNGGLLLLAAKTYAAVGDFEKTEELLTQAIEVQPTRLQAYSLLGALYVSQGRLNEARERFEEAVRRNPNGVAVNTVLGMVFGMLQKMPEAEKQYKTVLALDPGFPIAANNLAWLYVSQNKNLDEALQLAQSAEQKMPDEASVNDTLGWIYYRKNMIDPAIRHLEVSAQKDPNDAATHYHLGMAYSQAGEFDKAKKALQRALAITPQFEGSAEAKAKLSQLGG